MMTPRRLQELLADHGFYMGEIDGRWGPKGAAAMAQWFPTAIDLEEPVGPPIVQHMSQRGINDLIHSEGLRTDAYRDSVGVWTIGVGHAATSGRPPIPHAGMTVTKAEAMYILASDLAEAYEPQVRHELGPVPQHVFDGAVSFHFNTGAIGRASWVGKYKAGLLAEARRAFMGWDKPPEIVGRRTREAELIFAGKYFTLED